MAFHKILVLSDNESILRSFIGILGAEASLTTGKVFHFACYPKNLSLVGKNIEGYTIEPLDVKQDTSTIIASYDLLISAHCKQIFPAELADGVRCINIHPGYNPYNRGWYPQVFSILNHLPLGATIHEIDSELDHGKIIDQKEVTVESYDTSLSAYNRVQDTEILLLRKNLAAILDDNYVTTEPQNEGNVNFRKDFDALREISLTESATYGEVIDRLRALSHEPFQNAYFIDPKTGRRIWISVSLNEETDTDEKDS